MQAVRKRQPPSPLYQKLLSSHYLFHLYLWSVILVGWGILFSITPNLFHQITTTLLIEVLIWSILSFVSELKLVQLTPHAEISVSFAIHIAAIVYFGAPFALLIAAVGNVVYDLIGRRGLAKALFNAAQYSITIWATGFCFFALKKSEAATRLDIQQDFFAILVACAVYVTINWILVRTVVALATKLPLRDALSTHFKATLSYFIALVPLSVLMVILYEENPLLIFLLALPMLMTHNSLSSHMIIMRQARETIELLSDTIDERDPYTASHSKRVAEYARLIAQEMRLKTQEIEDIFMAGRVHDLGKIAVPDAILLKNDRLSDEEFAAIKTHPKTSFFLLSRIKMYEQAARLALHHHERLDGNGYPTGLKGESIPLGSRILAVADSYDAMTTDRPYRRALSQETAIAELERHKGTQFDPNVVDAFARVLSRKEVQN